MTSPADPQVPGPQPPASEQSGTVVNPPVSSAPPVDATRPPLPTDANAKTDSFFAPIDYDPPAQKTLVIVPDVRIIIGHGNKTYDLSSDVVRGVVIRREDAASTLVFTVSNKGGRYSGTFQRMDRVVCFLKRTTWVQVFSGYLDLVPALQLYPGTVDFRATCTIKRLMHTWWDPGLIASSEIMNQQGIHNNEVASGLLGLDAGLGSMLRRLVRDVGGWRDENIWVQQFPSTFADYVKKNVALAAKNTEETAMTFRHMLLGSDPGLGPGAAAGRNYSALTGAYMPGVTVKGKSFSLPSIGLGQMYYKKEVIVACDLKGMGPSKMDTSPAQGIGSSDEKAGDERDMPAWKEQWAVGKAWEEAGKQNDAAVNAFMTVYAETNWRMLANRADPASLSYPNDGESFDGQSVGLFAQQPWWGCLPASAQVFTSHGPVPIVDVSVGDEVWSYDGQRMLLSKVTTHFMNGYRSLLTIKTAGRELEVTANHRIPVRRYFGVKDGRRLGNQYKPSTCGWETLKLRADEIRPGDYLIVPHGMGEGTRRTTPQGREVTVGMMELAGLYLGDGCRDKGNQIIICHGQGRDGDHIPHYKQVIEQEFGVTSRTSGVEVSKSLQTKFSSAAAVAFLAEGFLGTAATKRLPGWVFRLDRELQLALLRGYLDSDGSVDKLGRVHWVSISRGLVEGIRHLCIQAGVPVGRVGVRKAKPLSIGDRTCPSKEQYEVIASSTRHNSTIGSNSPHKFANFATLPKQLKSRYDPDWNSSVCRRPPIGAPPGGSVYHRVLSVDTGAVEVPVYDLEVENTHFYVADGIVVSNSIDQRMNARASAMMFYEALGKVDWRNGPRGEICAQVQNPRPDMRFKYGAYEQQSIMEVRTLREAMSAGTGLLKGALSSLIGPTSLGLDMLGSGGLEGLVQAGMDAIIGASPGASGGAGRMGKPQPDSEGAINYAMTQLGTPYGYGSQVPGVALDCSALTQSAFKAIGVNIPRDTWGQIQVGQQSPGRRGDLVFPDGDAGHVGIYLGGGMMVHAPQTGDVVREGMVDPSNSIFRTVAANGGPDPSAPFNMPQLMGPGLPPNTGTTNTGTAGTTRDSVGSTEPIARNLFTYQFYPGIFANQVSELFGQGWQEKAFINDEPLIQMVAAVTKAGLRHYASAPNGDFVAYYPDYFGLDQKNAIWELEDIEIKNLTVNYCDDALTTHVYVCGAPTDFTGVQQPVGWLLSKGVATVEDSFLFRRLIQVSPGAPEAITGEEMMRKYGVRPYTVEMPALRAGEMEKLAAIQIFMQKWAEQYQTSVEFSFMPEIFPGMRLNLKDHGLQVYVHEVQQSFDFEQGFSTSATIMAPSSPEIVERLTKIDSAEQTGANNPLQMAGSMFDSVNQMM